MQAAGNLPGLGDLLAGSQIGGARPYQEDEFRIAGFRDPDPDGCDFLMVVADGMGGHQGGAEASRVAVAAFVDSFADEEGGVVERLRSALNAANAAVRSRAARNVRLSGMGCTLVACVVTDREEAHWISVGDSPLWKVRSGGAERSEMVRMNADHSMRPVLEELVRLGHATEEDVRMGSHQLRSAVTGDDLALVDLGGPAGLVPGDRLVLASDGVEALPETRIRRLSTAPGTAEGMVHDLLDAVAELALPSQDNATVLVYRHVQKGAVRNRLARLTATTQPGARRAGHLAQKEVSG